MEQDGQSTTTRLLTLLNVSATKSIKRKRPIDDSEPPEKLNKRRTMQDVTPTEDVGEKEEEMVVDASDQQNPDSVDLADNAGLDEGNDTYERHFGAKSADLTDAARYAVDNRSWKVSRQRRGKLGWTLDSLPEGVEPSRPQRTSIPEKLRAPLTAKQAKQMRDHSELQNDVLDAVSTFQDLYLPTTSIDTHTPLRDSIALHVMNYVIKKRRLILKNNDRLTAAAKSSGSSSAATSIQDQGFARPSILILLPFRSSALSWLASLTMHTPSPTYQIENHARFAEEYGLPKGAVDKLASAEPGTYPPDHVATFKGNIDESFRVGLKLTRKTVKLFSEFYGSDIILASPLGLKLSAEKEKNADFLSSIEIVVVDQLDALTMQNWDHVKFVFSHLNKLPKELHNTDFSRVKSWYLDGHAAYLRQTILLSAYETPETRSLFNKHLRNVAGKIRAEKRWVPMSVPEGVEQNFLQFDSISPKDEADRRFQYFTTQVLPAVLKSAVQSANTVIFVPSSFDFIRVHNCFRQHSGVTFTTLSEESSSRDISRARQAFFSGKKAFLLISERFHFYRRYKLRGIRNVIFYAPPDHTQFYAEFMSYPFLDDGVEAADVSCRVLYSRWDWFRLERIVGSERVGELVSEKLGSTAISR